MLIQRSSQKGGRYCERIKSGILGFAAGLLNGLFGAGGGMAAVPMLSAMGVETRKSHATSIAIILPLSAVSAYLYLRGGHLAWREAFPYLPAGSPAAWPVPTSYPG